MHKNNTHNPIFTELLIFYHGDNDLHELEVNKMKNMIMAV